MTVSNAKAPLIVLLLLLCPLCSGGPRLQVTPACTDFGAQTKNAGSYDFTFKLKNTGDAPLLINSVRTGCSCTTVSLQAQELAPGAATELRGQLLTTNYEGVLNKTITLETNDSSKPKNTVEVKVTLPYKEPGIHFWPRTANVYAGMQQEGLRARAWLENCDADGKTRVTKIVLPKGWSCEPSAPFTILAGERKALTLTLEKPAAEEFRDGSIVVHTDNADAASRKVEGSLVTTRPGR